MKEKYYTVYDKKDDTVVAFGRSREAAKMLGITLGSFYSCVTRQKSKKGPYAIVIESIKEGDCY